MIGAHRGRRAAFPDWVSSEILGESTEAAIPHPADWEVHTTVDFLNLLETGGPSSRRQGTDFFQGPPVL